MDSDTINKPADSQLQAEALYDRGLYQDAWNLLEQDRPSSAWRGRDRILIARLANNLGGPNEGDALIRLAYREAPQDPLVVYYTARSQIHRRGPLVAWHFTERSLVPDAGDQLRGEWLGLRGSILSIFRDFTRAEQLFAEADQLTPRKHWLYVEHAAALRAQDRYDEAFEFASRSLEMIPHFRPAVHELAYLYVIREEEDRAIHLLETAAMAQQSCALWGQLQGLYEERREFEKARTCHDKAVSLMPRLSRRSRPMVAASRASLAYLCGDNVAAVAAYRECGKPWAKKIADNLENAAVNAKRVQLPVAFVHQHHNTCGPATLTAISRYWSIPADHLTVAQDICYDGTPQHSERRWANETGYVTREFTVTWEAAVACIDRGVPFTLTTTDAVSGHLQAVIGYDERLRTLLIRDPFNPLVNETLIDDLLERHASTGPRGMLLVPAAQASRIDGLELPDSPLWDELFQINLALTVHDRPRADARFESMKSTAPDHRLTGVADRILAAYDADVIRAATAIDRAIQKYPKNGLLTLQKLALLRNAANHDASVALLTSAIAGESYDPIFDAELGRELLNDARERNRARYYLNRAVRRRPVDAESLHALATLRWEENDRAGATEIYRLAACIADRDERYARSYFLACGYLRKQDEAIRHLEDRFRRLGARSALPGETLYDALWNIDQSERATRVLEEAMQLRPDDGELLLFAANAYGRRAEFARANELIEKAKGKVAETSWLRAVADQRLFEGKPGESLELWRQVAEHQPLAIDAHEQIASRLGQLHSPEAAVEYVRSVATRFPHNLRIQRLLVERAAQIAPAEAEAAARASLAINPVDANMLRELAMTLSTQGRHISALEELEKSEALDPDAQGLFNIRGDCYVALGEIDQAWNTYAAGIRASVDNAYSLSGLLKASTNARKRLEAAELIERELARQVTFGDGLLAYVEHGAAARDPDTLLSFLQAARRERGDLWQTATAMMMQLCDMGRNDAACAVAREACDQFPLLPRIWLDRANAERLAGNIRQETESLERAVQLAPWWGAASRQLADLYTREGHHEQAIRSLERAIASSPADPYNHASMASVLWNTHKQDEAIARIERAIDLDPTNLWAWNMLDGWSRQMRQGDRVTQLARRHTTERPQDVLPWINLARSLEGESTLPERLQALDRAIEIEPRNLSAHDLRAALLANAHRFDEALAATRPNAFGDYRPAKLQIREAAIEAARTNFNRAITILRDVIADNERDFDAWNRLCSILVDRDHKEFGKAARRMTELFPNSAVAWFKLGQSHWQESRYDQAIEALRRAVTLDPTYAPGPFCLFDLLIERDLLDEAEEVLGLLKRHHVGEDTLSRHMILQTKRGSVSDVESTLRQLAESGTSDLSAFERSLEDYAKKVSANDVQRLFEEAAHSPHAQPELAGVWIRHLLKQGGNRAAHTTLHVLANRPAMQQRALLAAVRHVATHRDVKLLNALIRDHRKKLEADPELWGTVGYAMISCQLCSEVVNWMVAWESRDDIESWMMMNLSLAYTSLGRHADATRASQRAITLPYDQQANAEHHAMLAMQYGADARADDAGKHAQAARTANLDGFHEFCARCGEAVHRASTHPGEAANVLQSLKKDITSVGQNYSITWDAFNRTNTAISRMTGLSPKQFAAVAPAQKKSATPWGWIILAIIVARIISQLLSR